MTLISSYDMQPARWRQKLAGSKQASEQAVGHSLCLLLPCRWLSSVHPYHSACGYHARMHSMNRTCCHDKSCVRHWRYCLAVSPRMHTRSVHPTDIRYRYIHARINQPTRLLTLS
ncbi:hypothetical protein BKA81DRAFT_85853 [Phyllosticta paracitricarpa]